MTALAPPALECNSSRLLHPLTATDVTSRVLPSIFIPGMPKAGTSFLWGCVTEAFRPARVCGSDDWANRCGAEKRFALPSLAGHHDGMLVSPGSKEPFTFVREGGINWTALAMAPERFASGASAAALGLLLGPSLPLCMWQIDAQAITLPRAAISSTFQLRKLFGTPNPPAWLTALRVALLERMRVFCRQMPHSCRGGRGGRGSTNERAESRRRHAQWFRTALPVSSELGDPRAASLVDGTPNYLTSPTALQRIHWLHAHLAGSSSAASRVRADREGM